MILDEAPASLYARFSRVIFAIVASRDADDILPLLSIILLLLGFSPSRLRQYAGYYRPDILIFKMPMHIIYAIDDLLPL